MRFTRLRLVGFKSFVEPSDILIESGLTGIVGPNGCGKSNLVESLRWVMGESSHKSLRASGMDDVIFSGGGSRPARNSAEVSLTIDNADRTAPAQFNDADTLEVTRRIEREAGSVYKINGRDVRARDVQLLFADASTGAHSPALVRQGQIAEIIAAKPRDRRRILEEAAGISGLHSRRHEAELRLRAAEQNLERLDDVIGQLASQLDGLKRQARHASRYRALSSEIRTAEAILWHLKRLAAIAAIAEREAVLKGAETTVAERTEAAAAASRARAEAAAALPGLRDKEAEAAARLRHLTVSRDALDREKEQALARARELSGRLEQVAGDLARERATIASTDETLERLAAEERELAREEADTANAEDGLRQRLEAAETALGEAEGELGEATAAAAELAARRRQYERTVSEESQRIARLSGQVVEIDAESEKLGDGEAARELEGLSQAEATARQSAEAASALAEQADTALAEAREARDAARQPLGEAERDLKALETEQATLARVLESEIEGDWTPLLDAVSVERGLEAALGAAFGDDLDRPADEAAPIHWRTVPALPEDPALPPGVRPLAEAARAPDVLRRRLAQTGIVDAADGAKLQPLLKPGQRLVSAAGDLWRWDGYTAAADAPTAAARRLAQKNRLAELEGEIGLAADQLDALRRDAERADSAAREAAEAVNSARETARQAQSQAAQVSDRRAAAERKASQDTARLGALAEARLRLQSSLDESRKAAEEAQAGLESLTGETEIAARAEALKLRVAEARSAFTEARSALDGHVREMELRRMRRERLAGERARWAERTRDAEGQIANLEARETALRDEIASTSAIPDELEVKRGRLTREVDAAEAVRRDAADALASGETAVTEADRAAREADGVLSSAREAKAREEATLEGLQQRFRDLEETIAEAIGRPGSQALQVAGLSNDAELPSAERLESDLDRLKRDRERLGSVNLRAEEEMQEVGGRHEGLVTERKDLETAIARLRAAIQSLNREGRERLLGAFETVNAHFQHLFERLFGGGAAELKLTESDDPLEAGLEIIARPPGKRPTVLTLLSGGEQALTATALIFAVFLTNPAPICVLDEVDAPLDDANVERFCNLMEEMARTTETRFLLITHNPITMSRVDRLFGVTMAERGVSQLVSVDIQGAIRLRESA